MGINDIRIQIEMFRSKRKFDKMRRKIFEESRR